MKNAGNHIISRFNWDTVFDRKDKSFELQERISSWSKINMQKEISDVFGKMCPPEQIWRIQSLELDLGHIEYSTLETDLTLRLRKRLYEKLIDLIVYGKHANHQVEVLNEDTSHVQMLRSFLLTGVMPWTYRPSYGSVNELLAQQLRQNRPQLINMFRETGSAHDYVRKRMAWQFTEPNIVKTIQGLEPNHHEQVISFSNELNRIQAKETIVQSDTKDFRKNLWHWILNHLLTERGTIFNKVAFVKSSIMQMAAHHNISYDELLKMIERAVKLLYRYDNRKSGFLQTLELLVPQNGEALTPEDRYEENPGSFWQALEKMFVQDHQRKTTAQKHKFNELVVSLARADRSRFERLLRSFDHTIAFWEPLLKDLNTASTETIIQVLSAEHASHIVSTIQYLYQVTGKKNTWMWGTGIGYLLQNENTFDRRKFLYAFVQEQARYTNQSKMQVIESWLVQQNRSAEKNVVAVNTFTDFSHLLSKELLGISPVSLTRHLDVMVNVYTTYADEEEWLPQALEKLLDSDPVAAFQALMQVEQKETVKTLWPKLIRPSVAKNIIAHSKHQNCVFLQAWYQQLSEIKKESGSPAMILAMQDILVETGLYTLVTNPHVNVLTMVEEILAVWHKQLAQQQPEIFTGIMEQVLAPKQMQGPGISKQDAQHLRTQYLSYAGIGFLSKVYHLVKHTTSQQAEVGHLLQVNFSHTEFVKLRKSSASEKRMLMEYLLKNSARHIDPRIQQYTQWISAAMSTITLSTLQKILEEIYWKILLDYDAHRGNMQAFERKLNTAVLYRFPLKYRGKWLTAYTLETTLKKHHAQDKHNRLGAETNNDSDSVTPEYFIDSEGSEIIVKKPDEINHLTGNHQEQKIRLIILGEEYTWTITAFKKLVKKYFDKGVSSLLVNRKTIRLRDLLEAGFRENAGLMRDGMAQVPFSEKLAKKMKQAFGFVEFSEWLMHDTENTFRENMMALRSLSEMVRLMKDTHLAGKAEKIFYRQTWLLFTHQNISQEQWIKTTADLMAVLFTTRKTDPLLLHKAITGAENSSPVFRQVLQQFSPFTPTGKQIPVVAGLLNRYKNAELLYALAYSLVYRQELPVWHAATPQHERENLLRELAERYPSVFLSVLRSAKLPAATLRYLHEVMPMTLLIKTIGRLNAAQQTNLDLVEEFHRALTHVKIPGVQPAEIQAVLHQKLIHAWTGGNWRTIEIKQLWNEMIWEICVKQKIHLAVFIQEMEKTKHIFPPACQLAFDMVKQQSIKPVKKTIEPVNLPQIKLKPEKNMENSKIPKTGVNIKNAGLVLLNSYIPMLFDRLGLTKDKAFVDQQAQEKAVHYLQFVATGLCKTDENLLPLNKILCGLAVHQPVEDGIEMSEEQKKLTNGMIGAAIGYWPSIGDCTVNGFRGNWLVRDGLLFEQGDRWELTVEKRAYDILIHKSPFSFSIIKMPWMSKPLHVTWNY